MIIFYLVWILWGLSEVLLSKLLRPGTSDNYMYDKGSFLIIWITIIVANTLGVILTFFFHAPLGHSAFLPYAGLFIIVAGMMIRFTAIASLGKFFTVKVTIRKNHKIKTNGIYKHIRHPSYTGSILSFIGFGISLNNGLSLIVVVIPVTLAMIYRIRIEEQLLAGQFGMEYENYKKRTKRLIPFIW